MSTHTYLYFEYIFYFSTIIPSSSTFYFFFLSRWPGPGRRGKWIKKKSSLVGLLHSPSMPLPTHSLSGRRGERGEPSERDERFILDPFSFPIRFPICSHSSRVNCIEKKGLFPVLPISSLSFPSLSPFTYLEEISGEMKKQSIHPSHPDPPSYKCQKSIKAFSSCVHTRYLYIGFCRK